MKFNLENFKANPTKLSLILSIILFSFSSLQTTAQLSPEQMRRIDNEKPPRDTSGRVLPPTTTRGNSVDVTIGRVRRSESPLIKEINKELKADKKMLSKHLVFVKNKNTKVFRLLSDDDCLKEKKKSTQKCSAQKRLINGLARGYSFRARKNIMSMFADINLNGENLQSKDTVTQTILVDLGKENFDELNLESAGLKFLAEYEPETDINKAQQQFISALNGIEVENEDSSFRYTYSKSVPVNLDNSYAVRTIFYNSEQYKASGFEQIYSKDNSDVIAVFKIIDIDEEGHITVIWKELAKKDAPYLVLPDNK